MLLLTRSAARYPVCNPGDARIGDGKIDTGKPDSA